MHYLSLRPRSGGPLLCLLLIGLQAFFAAGTRAQGLGDLADRAVALSTPQVTTAGKTAETTLQSAAVAAPFTGVVVRGRSTDRQTEGWIRFETSAGWSAWAPLYLVFSATEPTFLAGYRGAVVRQDQRFELRFAANAAAGLTLLEAGVYDAREDADAVVPEETTYRATGGAASGLIVPPRLVRRSEWGAEGFVGDPIPLARPNYLYITFHHAAGYSATTLPEGKQQVKAIQDFHQNGRGWSDIGYHFVMDKSGNMYQGRPFLNENQALEEAPALIQGAHAGGANTGNIGLCILGCFHPPAGATCRDVITEAALDSVITMFAFLSERYGVPPDKIRGHRDFGDTSCPGDNNYALLDEIRQRVATLLVTGNQPLGKADLTAESDEEGVVHLAWAFLEDGGIETYRIERAYLNTATVIYRGTGAGAAEFIDREVRLAGPVTYRLYAVSPTGREQLLAVAEALVVQPERYRLAASFPNPTTGTTTLRYYLEQDGLVTLRLYDTTGREVRTLVDEPQDGGQWYHRTFDASGLASGTYYYRLQVEGFSGVVFDETRAVLVVR